MITQDEEKLLVQIAEMYYLDNKTQSQISRELNIHRSTISRLLKTSREKGIVEIRINKFAAGTYSYEEEIEKKFGIKKAIVIPSGSIDKKQTLNDLGKACSEYLKTIIADKMVLGFSWGSAMSAFARNIEGIDKKNVTCVPMLGGPAGATRSDYHVNTITFEASQNLHGRALLIDSPAIPETLELKKALMETAFNQLLIDYWHKIDIAIFGIGSASLKTTDRWKNFYGEDVFEIVEENKVAGDVVSRFYDKEGNHIASELDSRIIGIDIDDLRRVPIKIGIAESKEKVQAIKGALLGGYVNVLVTTESTAQELLGE